MIDGFKCCVCCVLVLVLQFILSPIATNAAVVMQVVGVETKPAVSNYPSSTSLLLSISAGREMVVHGEFVSYELKVANTSKVLVAHDVRLMDLLPTGFRLKKGSVLLNGIKVSDPNMSADGRALTFAVGNLAPGTSSIMLFEAEVTVGSPLDKAVSFASVFSSDSGVSIIEKASVTVRDQKKTAAAKPILTVPPEANPASAVVNDTRVDASADDAATMAFKAAVTAAQALPSSPPVSPNPLDDKKTLADGRTVSGIVVSEKPTKAELAGRPDVSALLDGGSQQKVPNNNKSALLQVDIRAGRDIVAPGDIVDYDLTVTNTSKLKIASDVRLMDVLPAGFRFNKGTAQLNGLTASDPTISKDGRALTFNMGTLLPGASSTIRFEVKINTGIPRDKAVNVASAFSSDSEVSSIAKATVTLRDDLQHVKALADLKSVIPVTPLSPVVVSSGSGVVSPVVETGAGTIKTAVTSAPSPVLSSPPELPKVPAVAETEPAPQPPLAVAQVLAPLSDSSEQPVRSVDIETEEKLQTDDPVAGEVVVQKTQSLAELIGTSDISVLSDVDGQFVKNMAENQTLENEYASRVDETNLLESIRVGRSFNRESRAALARTEQANAQTGQAFALLLPSISIRANYGTETSEPSMNPDVTGPDTHSRTDASLSVRQPLFDLPSFMDWRRRKLVEQARGENYKVSDGDAYISAVNAYLSIVSSRLQTDMTREFEARLNDLLIYVEKRAKAGAASHSDMARVRARSQATLSTRLEQESAHAAAGIEFIRLTNLVPRKVRLPAFDDIGASLLPKSMDMAVATAMKSNPEITALAAEIQAAEIDKQVAKGRYLPRIDAEYTNSYSLHAGGNTSSAGQKDQRLMMVLNWGLFSGGSDYKGYVERTSRHKEIQYRLDDQRRRVVQSLSANYATLATTRERITSGYQEFKSISSAAEAMSKRMLSGNQSLLDMLDVYDRLYQVRSRLVSLHILEMSTAAQLVRLTRGTPGALSEVKTEPDMRLQSK